MDTWLVQNPGKRITDYDLCRIFTGAYSKTDNTQKAVKGFQSTGIFPFNPAVFTDDDFAPATVTEQCLSDVENCNDLQVLSPQELDRKDVSKQRQHRKCVRAKQSTNNHVSVTDISPLPKVSSVGPRKRKAQTSIIVTSTPVKKTFGRDS